MTYIYAGMRDAARKALSVIQDWMRSGRYRLLPHFLQRLDQRGLFWPDVQSLLGHPHGVRYGGPDERDREKWLVSGEAADGGNIEVVCVLGVDERGEMVVFITIYWQER